MVQTYSQNRLAAIFFVVYVLIGIYCLMSLVTAVIYNQFKGFFQVSCSYIFLTYLNSSKFLFLRVAFCPVRLDNQWAYVLLSGCCIPNLKKKSNLLNYYSNFILLDLKRD